MALNLGQDSGGNRRSPLFVSELLSWIERFAAEEAPRLIHDSGKDGVVAMKDTLAQPAQFATFATTQVDVPAAFKTARVSPGMGGTRRSTRAGVETDRRHQARLEPGFRK